MFIISYESVFVYEKAINNINLWDEKVRDYNKRINLEILNFLKKQKKEISLSSMVQLIIISVFILIQGTILIVHKVHG